MLDEDRAELDRAIEAYIAAHRRLLAASRAYFGDPILTEHARADWRQATDAAASAAATLRAVQDRIALQHAEVAQYVEERLGALADG